MESMADDTVASMEESTTTAPVQGCEGTVGLSQEEVFHTTSLFTTEDDQIKYGSRMLKTVKAMEAAKLDWNRVNIDGLVRPTTPMSIRSGVTTTSTISLFFRNPSSETLSNRRGIASSCSPDSSPTSFGSS